MAAHDPGLSKYTFEHSLGLLLRDPCMTCSGQSTCCPTLPVKINTNPVSSRAAPTARSHRARPRGALNKLQQA
eukprot:8027468-Pyramimonas_sp.AAC.1